MNRGRRAEKIFRNDDDYKLFINILKESTQAWGFRICAYCLMPNHYHLLVQTPLANISRGMRHINGVYTQRFNRKHKIDGSLFRGRYKSILIDSDNYLLALVRYVHKNPSKANMASFLQYKWSSHKGYISDDNSWDWIYKDFVYNLLTKNNRKDPIKTYQRFITEKQDSDLTGLLEGEKWPGILGGNEFTDQIKQHYSKIDPEITQTKELAPQPEHIILSVCKYYGVTRESLDYSRRGAFNEPRNVALFLMRRLRQDSLQTIGQSMGIKKYSSVSSAIERLKNRMETDSALKENISKLLNQFL